MSKYGIDPRGNAIIPPEGWRLLNEGEIIPAIHRQYFGGNFFQDGSVCYHETKWSEPKRTKSTMTPMWASVSGLYIAYAVPIDTEVCYFNGWLTQEEITAYYWGKKK